LRVERQWNWGQLAQRAGPGVKGVQVQEIEEARRDPGFSTLLQLAAALELGSLDELLRAPVLEA
jgi:hypothetical protein